MYIYQHKNWISFPLEEEALLSLLAEVRYLQGKLIGKMESLGFDLQDEANLETLIQDVLQTSEIEGEIIDKVVQRHQFWQKNGVLVKNDRQRKRLTKLLDDFEGNLTTSKWAKITKTSQDTALRDITDLVANKVLVKAKSGGRNTHYTLNL